MGPQLRNILGQLHRLAGREHMGALADAELLERYVQRRDEAAFEVLVWRHGGMVLGVCRRLLGQEQDAEDAFQATFLALARGAGSISQRESAAGWLYRVAWRIARKVRASRRTTQPLPDLPLPGGDPTGETVWRDLRPVLDEEVSRLPVKYRVPFVLCYLEGKTNGEAARELGWPTGTVATRLARARQRLRTCLTRRGLAVSTGLLAMALVENAAAAPAPVPLVLTTVKAGLAFAAGGALGEGVVAGHVITLTKGALHAMTLDKLKIVTPVLLAACLAVTTAAFAAHHVLADRPGPLPAHQVRTADVPKQADTRRPAAPAAGRLLFYRAGHLTLIGPDGKNEKRVSQNRGAFHPTDGCLSPDGKRVAYLVVVDKERAVGRDPRRKVYIRGLDQPEPGTDLGVEAQRVTWSPDGKELVAADVVHGDNPKAVKFVNWLVEVRTKEKTPLKLPDNHMVTDWSRDGKHFLTSALDFGKQPPGARLCLASRDGSEIRELTDGSQRAFFGRLSPDARRVLYLAPDPQRKGKELAGLLGLFILDVHQRKSVRLLDQPLDGDIMGFAWSPDGKRIAYAWRQAAPAPGQQTESHLIVADRDGRNPVTIATERGDSPGTITIDAVSWR
jgi:RNA polymerase sigma factor (sigma-70 family)